MELCTICHNVDASEGRTADDGSFCPTCGILFRWFLDHYADVEFSEPGWIIPETTFHELSIESLDYVHWALEAEEMFGVTISDEEAERLKSIADYLRYIRLHGNLKGHKAIHGVHDPLWDRGLDG